MTRIEEKAPGMARLFMAGDVMPGRGIDQILPRPCDPTLYEDYMRTATGYVKLAELRVGPIPRSVGYDYIWGALLPDLDARHCDLRLINLETAITRDGRPAPKGINYRMSPENAAVLAAARIDACTLANNHVLDWGVVGLRDTLATLENLGIGQAGAGRTEDEACQPLVRPLPSGGRALILAFGHRSAGVPCHWSAGQHHPGIALLPESPEQAVTIVKAGVAPIRKSGDVVVVSVHWGSNWGFEIPAEQRRMAHALVDDANVDIVFGHSSHHPKGLEIHRERLILYGCGDLVNDYEGISGHAQYNPDLGLAFIADLEIGTGRLGRLEILPYFRRAFRLVPAGDEAVRWLSEMLSRDSHFAGWRMESSAAGTIGVYPPPVEARGREA